MPSTPKRGRGRPRTEPDKKLDVVSFRIDAALAADIEAVAEEIGEGRATTMRELIKEAIAARREAQ